ncbi:GNAT family N-acetyltransferase [Saccharopolyspora sp. 5N708]|uniref:GNAT family N-acetyltransferase n=1 Tax=Saccharopolyspora sp. 5N708 TaxID=3457424 RepID=UPI003FD42D06
MVEPEEIRTRRLILRRIQPGDSDAFVAVHTDPATYRYDPFDLRTPQQALELLERFQDCWRTDGIGYWTIRRIGSQDVIGFGGLRLWVEEGESVLNLYYRLRPVAWGNGYAPEMAEAAVRWANRNRPDRPVLIVTKSDNTPSVRVAEKLGFVRHLERERDGQPEVLFRLPAPGPTRRRDPHGPLT